MTVDAWLRMAVANVIERGLPEMTPLLEGLAQSTRRLRDVGIGEDARGGNDSIAATTPATPEGRA